MDDGQKPLGVVVNTIACPYCGLKGKVTVNRIEFENWESGDECIQNAMPSADVDTREQLISGTHPACWNKIFPPEVDIPLAE